MLTALALSVRDRSQVVIPFLKLPLPELCLMRRLASVDCPGCGLTRCFISLAHGDLPAAWSYNPAGLWHTNTARSYVTYSHRCCPSHKAGGWDVGGTCR